MHIVSSLSLSSINLSAIFKTKKEQCLDFSTWIFFRLALLWDAGQRAEYRQFYEIKRLSTAENKPEMTKLFKEKVIALCQKISDESITQHLTRLDPDPLKKGLESQPYFKSTGEEKTLIKAHEVFEMLSMKWEKGLPFNRDRLSEFWPAHQQAIRVENIFHQALALEKGINLTKEALEYCRIYDQYYLHYPLQQKFTNGSFILDLEDTEKNLTKNTKAMPKNPDEIDSFFKYFSQFMKDWSPRIKIGICQRYLYSQLSVRYPEKKLYLITLLRALENDENYHEHSLQTILSKLNEHLQNFNLPECWHEESILKKAEFFMKYPKDIPFVIREPYNHLKSSFKNE